MFGSTGKHFDTINLSDHKTQTCAGLLAAAGDEERSEIIA